MSPIHGMRPPAPVEFPSTAGPLRPGAGGPSFKTIMAQTVEKVNGLQKNAQATALRFLQGEPVEVHQVALEQQQASMAFDLLVEVRNKMVSAYQEVMRMPL